jgi:hypothetical protein
MHKTSTITATRSLQTNAALVSKTHYALAASGGRLTWFSGLSIQMRRQKLGPKSGPYISSSSPSNHQTISGELGHDESFRTGGVKLTN